MHTLFGGSKRSLALKEEQERIRREVAEERVARETAEREKAEEDEKRVLEEERKRENMVLVSEVCDGLLVELHGGRDVERIVKIVRMVVSVGMWEEIQKVFVKQCGITLENSLRDALDPSPGLAPIISALRKKGVIWLPLTMSYTYNQKPESKLRPKTSICESSSSASNPAMISILKTLSGVDLMQSGSGCGVTIISEGKAVGVVAPTPFDIEELKGISKRKKMARGKVEDAEQTVGTGVDELQKNLEKHLKQIAADTDAAIEALRIEEASLIKAARREHNDRLASLNHMLLDIDAQHTHLNKQIATAEAALSSNNPQWQATATYLLREDPTTHNIDPIFLSRTAKEMALLPISPSPRRVARSTSPKKIPLVVKKTKRKPDSLWVRPDHARSIENIAFSEDGLTVQPMVTSCSSRHVLLSRDVVSDGATHYWEVAVGGSPGSSVVGVVVDGVRAAGVVGKQPGTWGVCLTPAAHPRPPQNCITSLGEFLDGDRIGLHLHLYRQGHLTTGKLYCHKMPVHPSRRSATATLNIHCPTSFANPAFRLIAVLTTPNVSLRMNPEALPVPV